MDTHIHAEEGEKKKKLQFLHPLVKSVTYIIAKIIRSVQPILSYWCTELIVGLIFHQIFLLVSYRFRQFPLDIILPSWIYFSLIHLLKFKLFYMLKYQLPIFLIAIITVHLGEKGWRLAELRKLYERLMRLVFISKWKATLINKFICASVMSFASYFAFVNWTASGLIFVWGDPYYVIRNVLSFVAILVQFVEVDSVWNLGAAVSNGKDGMELWKISSYFGEGGRMGILIMVIHFGWCFSVTIVNAFTGEGDNYTQVVYSGIADLVLYSSLAWAKVF